MAEKEAPSYNENLRKYEVTQFARESAKDRPSLAADVMGQYIAPYIEKVDELRSLERGVLAAAEQEILRTGQFKTSGLALAMGEYSSQFNEALLGSTIEQVAAYAGKTLTDEQKDAFAENAGGYAGMKYGELLEEGRKNDLMNQGLSKEEREKLGWDEVNNEDSQKLQIALAVYQNFVNDRKLQFTPKIELKHLAKQRKALLSNPEDGE